MRARTLSFYIDRNLLSDVTNVIDNDLLPRHREMPHFLGLIVIDTGDRRREVVGMSVWDGDLADSEEVIAEVRGRLGALAGTSPATRSYDVLRLVVNEGVDCAEWGS
ncbi:MAG TPA: hypothetical protein VEJ44_00580 [Acidimicrobiales bacterium]|nr:hypothetical protein [Acidimicrobiales bacterium]